LQGILIDQWRLWEKKTGIKVEIQGMDWSEALRRMEAGEFDVIDTVFKTEARSAFLDFSKPYTRIEVPIFFQRDISGITDLKSLTGFPVAAKAGDAAIDLLKQNDITTVLLFNNYESIVKAAQQRKVNVFVVDAPPALYFLNKLDIGTQFRRSAPINVGEFHRAVRKGNTALLKTVEAGFAAITPGELKHRGEMVRDNPRRRFLFALPGIRCDRRGAVRFGFARLEPRAQPGGQKTGDRFAGERGAIPAHHGEPGGHGGRA
jgi:ABC-type amino acid transport substrate-binding protein